MIHPRMRLTALAASMALTMSIAAAPVVTAQDDPTATIQSFMDAIAAKDFEALPSYFCEDQAAQAARFDISALAGQLPEGFDAQALLDALILDIQLDSIGVVSQSDTEAVVAIAGSISMDVDAEALAPFVAAIIEMAGMEADEATIELFTGMMLSQFEGMSEDIDGELTLVPGDEMPWLICSVLDFGGGAMDDLIDDGSAADATDGSMDADSTADPMGAGDE